MVGADARQAREGRGQESDLDLLLDLCDNIFGRSFCALGDGATSPISSSIQYFRDEYLAHLTHGGCPFDPRRPLSSPPQERAHDDDRAAEQVVKTVTLTIDDVEVTVPEGTLVIRAAEEIGVQIPRFCDHPLLDPVGACRQCLVDIPDAGNGRPTQAAGVVHAAGRARMVVRTQHSSPVADKAQQGNMESLLINHPLDCPVCDKGGECPLQNQAMTNGRGESRFDETKRTFPKPINISAQILLDRERCVLCARCTRFSEQIAGDPFIALIERGALQQVGIYEKEPFESYFSGNTVQICPVGALTSAAYRFRARPFDLVSTPSICEHCASGCALRTDHRRGKVTRRLAGNDPASTRSGTATRAASRSAPPRLDDRLTRPMVRDDDAGELRVASWPEAFVVAARGLRRPVLGRRARRRPAHRRGRLRVRQVRPRRARHQRHRLPRPASLGRGGRLPRGARRHQGRGHLRRPRARERCRPRRVRARGGVADRVPAAAQGRPRARHPGLLRRLAHLARTREARRHAAPGRARRRGSGDRGCRLQRRRRARRRRRDPRRRAARRARPAR